MVGIGTCKFSTNSGYSGSEKKITTEEATIKDRIGTEKLPLSAFIMPLRTRKSKVTGALVVFISGEQIALGIWKRKKGFMLTFE